MNITCFIRYKIDPYRLVDFKTYAHNWGRIIPACGGQLIGYFLPDEGTNNIAYGLIGFASLADYESYRARLKQDPAGRANFEFAQKKKFILEESRSFLKVDPATLLKGISGYIATEGHT